MQSFLNESTKLPEVEPLRNDETDGLDALRQLFDSQDLSNEVEVVSAPKETLTDKAEQSLSIEFQSNDISDDSDGKDTLGEIFGSIKNEIITESGNRFIVNDDEVDLIK